MKFIRQKIQQGKEVVGIRIDNPGIKGYNHVQRPVFVSEDQALEYLAEILVDLYIKQKNV
ncbi:MAG: hypothetical protein AAB913_01235 [Patescibacteria group bacterium]